MNQVAPNCFFTPEEDTPINPVVGKKTSMLTNTPKPFYRTSELDEIPDNFAERMRKFKRAEVRTEEREVITPNGFAVSIAFNKGAYMVIPKEDL